MEESGFNITVSRTSSIRRLPGGLLLLAVLGSLGATCAMPGEDLATRERAKSVTPEAFERILPELQKLQPGDDDSFFDEHVSFFGVKSNGQWEPDLAVFPGWIGGMSGNRPGASFEGFSPLGKPFAKHGKVIRGRHVFGYVWGGMNIAPRFQVVTEAVPIEKAEFDQLQAQHAERTGSFLGESGWRFFRDFRVVETGFLPFAGAPDREGVHVGEPIDLTNLTEAFYSERAFRETARKLQQLPPGTDYWSMLKALDAFFITRDDGEDYAIAVKGFWGGRSQTKESEDAIRVFRPFGYEENGREQIKLIAIFENDLLKKVVTHTGLEDWSGYLTEP